jgi:hypothetical protein
MEDNKVFSNKNSNNITIGIIGVPEEDEKQETLSITKKQTSKPKLKPKPEKADSKNNSKSISPYTSRNSFNPAKSEPKPDPARSATPSLFGKHAKNHKQKEDSRFNIYRNIEHDGLVVTPELAAQVVKNYLLPMFESDEKKYLRKNRGLDRSILKCT